MKHRWNVVIVNKFGFPREPSKEFQVFSKSMLGAVMIASRVVSKEHKGCKIKSVWRLHSKSSSGEVL